MIILFEDYYYNLEDISAVLPDKLLTLSVEENRAKTTFVGYHYSDLCNEPVFILPKVIIDKNGIPFGKIHLSDSILRIDQLKDILEENEVSIISSLSFWLYQAIVKYKEIKPSTTIVRSNNLQEIKSIGEYQCHTLVEIIQSLRKFNKDHQLLFSFIVNCNRSGVRNINWNKTITKIQPFLQHKNPIYLSFYNNDKNINFDEEIIVLFYSVLSYLMDKYFFFEPINLNFNLIPNSEIETMIEQGMGTIYLNKLRHKYFHDELVQLWNLLYVFFEKEELIQNKQYLSEDVLATSFNNVFESMIDQLIGDKNWQDDIRVMKDGKIIDHLYVDDSLINNGYVYHIADSKYYKESSDLDEKSIYKQFTYARNIIQYNLNLFHVNDKRYMKAMRDELTEGYNIVPNFFIRGNAIGEKGIYDYDSIELEEVTPQDTNKSKNQFINYHFSNRLFDRDTLILNTYNINFLYVLAKFVEGEDIVLKKEIHDKFRKDIIRRFNSFYSFYKLTPKDNKDLTSLVDKHFRRLHGKIIRPYDECEYLVLALEKVNVSNDEKFQEHNQQLLHIVESDFKKSVFDLNPNLNLDLL